MWELEFLKIHVESRETVEVFSLLDPENIQEKIFVEENHHHLLKGVTYLQNRLKYIKTLLKGLVQPNTSSTGIELRTFLIYRLLQVSV